MTGSGAFKTGITALTGIVLGVALGYWWATPKASSIPGDVVGTVRHALTQLKDSEAAGDIFEARPSAIPGFIEARRRDQMVYVSSDGRYVLIGAAYDAKNREDLSEKSLQRDRAVALRGFDMSAGIRFAPDHPTFTVTVFTDIDCPFCRRFQEQIAAYNAKGIAVNYLPFPLNIHPEADRKARAVWCAGDRKEAFASAMTGVEPPAAACDDPIAKTRALALSIGISGTPSVIAADGGLLPPGIALNPDSLATELARRHLEGKAL